MKTLNSDIDVDAVRRQFSRAAGDYAASASLQREIASRLQSRLDLLTIAPRFIVDVGCGTGEDLHHLRQRYTQASALIAMDLSTQMLHHLPQRQAAQSPPAIVPLVADYHRIPLADASVDLIYSNVSLQWAKDLPGVIAEFNRILRPGGLVIFSTFGRDTLCELRESFARVDDASHTLEYWDMHDIGDILVARGFEEPVMETEYFTLQYRTLPALLRELRSWGATNRARGRARVTKAQWRSLQQHYIAHYRDEGGWLPATYEVIYAHAWRREDDPTSAAKPIKIWR